MQEEPLKPQEELVILILTVGQLNLLTDEHIAPQEVVLLEVQVAEITIVLLVEVLVTEALHRLPHQEVEVALQQEEAVHQDHHPHLQDVVQDDLIDKHL